MARFILNFIALSAIFLNGYVVAYDYADVGELPANISPPIMSCFENEVLDMCAADCPSDYCPKSRNDDQSPCPKPKKCPLPLCKCGFNSRKVANGTCISTRDCPPFKCNGKNEEYNPCPPYCPGEDCSQATPDGKCHVRGRIGITVECKPACRCKKNYWRLNGVCVPYDRCPKNNDTITSKPTRRTNKPKCTTSVPKTKCGANEVLDKCPSDCPANYCPKNRYTDQTPCRKPKRCPPPRCQCRSNYRRASNGSCIPTRNCPAFECNRENEEYRPCPSYCPGENCRDASLDGECNARGRIPIPVDCKPACRCKKNFWRLNGNCVPYSECSNVNSTTTTEKNTPKTTTQSNDQTTTTKPPTCDDDEVLDNCPVQCPADNCPKSRYDDQSRCPKPDKCRPPACKCRFNTRRADNGTCIPTRDCPPFECNGPNEEYNSCPPYCPGENCSQATPDGKCPSIGRIGIVLECKPACRCKRNFWRNKGMCVPYNQCPNIATTKTPPETTPTTTEPTENQNTTATPTLTCDDNEIAVECPNKCADDYCLKSRYDGKLPCRQSDNCPPTACKCRFNYRRADNGSCIPARECPPFPCDGPNEVYNPCPPLCPGEDCSQATPDGRCPIFGTIGIVLECEAACRCKKNYWRLNGTCVPYKQCPNRNDTTVVTTERPSEENPTTKKPKLKCGPSEVVDDCPVDCPSNYCPKSETETFKPCPRPNKCPPPACRCKLGTYKHNNGSCVPIQDCPPFECKRPNEEYRACYPVSPGENCSEAVPEKDMKPTEELTLRCQPACRCKKNYWRLNGVCVPYKKCGRSYCPEHETEVLCKNACSESKCPKREADTLPFACPDVCLGSGCACERNYRRASNGTCIPTVECPPFDCSARPNEMYVACPSTCPGDSCEDIGTTRDSCPRWRRAQECTPACQCIKGYRRNNTGICVPTAQCPVKFPANEEYTSCSERLCRPQNCSDVAGDTFSFICEPDKTDGCNAGCVCKDGYVRADNGTCVSEEECKSPNSVKCSGPYEEYTDSKQSCPNETCAALTSKFKCENVEMKPGCVCISGYRRKTEDGPCVPMCKCPEMVNAPACKKETD